MKTYFKPAHLAASIALALGAATTTLPVQAAVTLSDNNLGEVAVVPFYSTRGHDTYLSIVNTSNRWAIAVKLRFREADNSRDARDFNIVLSPNDVWTAVVTIGADGETPIVKTSDTSCTAPRLPDVNDTQRGISFTAIDYNGGTGLGRDASDDDDVGIDRTQDGHFEVIMMGVSEPGPNRDGERNIAGYATHDSGYFDCRVVATALSNPFDDVQAGDETLAAAENEFREPLNVMKVAANVLDVDSGIGAMIPVTMLSNWVNGADGIDDLTDPDFVNRIRAPQDENPNLDSGEQESLQIIDGQVVSSFFLRPVDAVSSLMMATEVLNEFAIGGGAQAINDWVVTFPTKNFYVDARLGGVFNFSDRARPPFSEWFQSVSFDFNRGQWVISPGNGRSCDEVRFGYFDREENPFTEEDPEFSPAPEGETNSICYEVQTIEFGAESVLNGRNAYGVPLEFGFDSGWMRLQLFGDGQLVSDDGVILSSVGDIVSEGPNRFYGLPVLSFGIKAFTNGVTSEGNMLNYAFTQPAAFARRLEADVD